MNAYLIPCSFYLTCHFQYDFRKTAQNPNHVEFQHPSFRRNQPELLLNIRRKPSRHKATTSKFSGLGESSSVEMRKNSNPPCLCDCNYCASCLNRASAGEGMGKRKASSNTAGGVHAESDRDSSDEGDSDDHENESDHEHEMLVEDYGLGAASSSIQHGEREGGSAKMRSSTGSNQSVTVLECRVSRLETDNQHMRALLDDAQLKLLVLQGVLDEVFSILGTFRSQQAELLRDKEAGALPLTKQGSSSPPPSSSSSSSSATNAVMVPLSAEHFVVETKNNIFKAVWQRVNQLDTTNPSLQYILQSTLFPTSASTPAMTVPFLPMSSNALPAPPIDDEMGVSLLRGLGSLDFGMSINGVGGGADPAQALHALDGMELSQLRGRREILQPTSFDLAASSVQQPTPSQLQRLSSFFEGGGPPTQSLFQSLGPSPTLAPSLPSSSSSSVTAAVMSSIQPFKVEERSAPTGRREQSVGGEVKSEDKLQLLSSSADIVIERDTMSSYDYKFSPPPVTPATISASAVDPCNQHHSPAVPASDAQPSEDSGDQPVAKKARGSPLEISEGEHAAITQIEGVALPTPATGTGPETLPMRSTLEKVIAKCVNKFFKSDSFTLSLLIDPARSNSV